ncbi:MAG: YqeG family HAD IIIA-type phosphatase [Bacilli bacterium]
MKKYIPYATSKNIYEINPQFYVDIGVKNLIIDLDNTLDCYKSDVPNEETKQLIQKLLEKNLNLIIISNNTKKRVSKYANELKVDYISSACKPFRFKIKKYLKNNNLVYNQTILIGDQLLTDIKVANKLKIKSIFVEKLVESDQWTTRFNRHFERKIKNNLIKKNLLVDWRTLWQK